MNVRGLAVLLLAYVTLDFANPLMPGAVRFTGGVVDVVHADRARPATPTVPAEFVPTPEKVVVDWAVHVKASTRPTPVPEPLRRTLTRIRRAPASSADQTALSEDH